MPGVSVDFGDSARNFERLVDEQRKKMDEEIEEIIHKTVNDIIRIAKRHTPVRTGRLRGAWRGRRTGRKHGRSTTYEIYNNTKYAYYIENGTRKNGKRCIVPRKMLANALEDGEKLLQKRLKQLGTKTSRNFR